MAVNAVFSCHAGQPLNVNWQNAVTEDMYRQRTPRVIGQQGQHSHPHSQCILGADTKGNMQSPGLIDISMQKLLLTFYGIAE
jgi:hypothetical protein